MSNSKLNIFQKRVLKSWRKENRDVRFFVYGRVTFAYKLYPKTAHVSWSIASSDEQKLRGKVGKFHAMGRFVEGKTLPVEFDPQWNNIEAKLADLEIFITNS